jgi:hypothetical protein
MMGRLSQYQKTCMDYRFQTNGSKLTGQECITKNILGLWEHIMYRIWTYHNNIYHENNNQQVARYKTEALDRRYEDIWEKHAGLVKRIHAFQMKQFDDRQRIGNLNYESKRCWANLADMYTLSKLLGAILGVG